MTSPLTRLIPFLALAGVAEAQEDRLQIWKPVPLTDGARAAVPCYDGTVRLFALATGETEAILSGHEGTVWAVQPAPDGKTLASCGEDETLRLWNLEDGSCIATVATPRLHPYWGHTLSFSPSGESLVAVTAEGWAKVWDARTGEERFTLPPETKTSEASWAPDGRLVTVGRDKHIRFWDTEKGAETREPIEHEKILVAVGCHPDGVRIATADIDSAVHLWSTETGERLGETRAAQDVVGLDQVNQLLFSPDGNDLLLAAGGYWRVYALDARTLQPRWSFVNGGGSAAPIRVALDGAGRYVGYSTLGRIVRREDGVAVEGVSDIGSFLQWAPGDRFVVSYHNHQTHVLDGETFEVLYGRTELPEGKSAITE